MKTVTNYHFRKLIIFIVACAAEGDVFLWTWTILSCTITSLNLQKTTWNCNAW